MSAIQALSQVPVGHLVQVKFSQKYPPYNAEEVAAFDPEVPAHDVALKHILPSRAQIVGTYPRPKSTNLLDQMTKDAETLARGKK